MEENKSQYLKWIKSHKLLTLMSDQKSEHISQKFNSRSQKNQSIFRSKNRTNQKTETSFKNKERDVIHFLTKNRNKIQTNILRHKKAESKQMSSNQHNSKKQQAINIKLSRQEDYFRPKVRKQILKKYKSGLEKENNFQNAEFIKSGIMSLYQQRKSNHFQIENSTGQKKTKISNKSRLGSKHSLMVKSIEWVGLLSEINSKIIGSKNQEITEYTRQELQSYYLTLIKFSKGNPRKYKQGFQTMLNLMDVPTNEKVLTQQFNSFAYNPTLQQFYVTFSSIVRALIRQRVIDFFEIVFEESKKKELTKQELRIYLSQRLSARDAATILDQIQQYLNWDTYQPISTASILGLCCKNDDFCCFMRQFNILQIRK